jgi:hypothetical protein
MRNSKSFNVEITFASGNTDVMRDDVSGKPAAYTKAAAHEAGAFVTQYSGSPAVSYKVVRAR